MIVNMDPADKSTPCPFCRSERTLVAYIGPTAEQAAQARSFGEDYDAGFYVLCEGCGASGPLKSTRDEANSSWNLSGEPVEYQMRILVRVGHPTSDPDAPWETWLDWRSANWQPGQTILPEPYETRFSRVEMRPLYTVPPPDEIEKLKDALAWYLREVNLLARETSQRGLKMPPEATALLADAGGRARGALGRDGE